MDDYAAVGSADAGYYRAGIVCRARKPFADNFKGRQYSAGALHPDCAGERRVIKKSTLSRGLSFAGNRMSERPDYRQNTNEDHTDNNHRAGVAHQREIFHRLTGGATT